MPKEMNLMDLIMGKPKQFGPEDLLMASNDPDMMGMPQPDSGLPGGSSSSSIQMSGPIQGSFKGQYGREFDDQFNESMKDRKSAIEALQAKLAETEANKPTGLDAVNLRPALAYADSLMGTQTAYAYQDPKKVQDHQAQVEKLRQAVSQGEDKLSDDQLAYLKMKADEESFKLRESNAQRAAQKGQQGLEFRLREKWDNDPITKNTKTVLEGLGKIESAYKSNDPADYLTMIYGLMRMQDPTSTVREAEFKAGEGIGGWPEAWRAAYQKAIGDRRGPITPQQKDSIMRQAQGIYQSQIDRQKQVDEVYRGHAAEYGFNPKRIVMSDIFTRKDDKNSGRITVTNGSETLVIDQADLAEATKEGFKVVK